MFKKLGKAIGFVAVIGAIAAGGMAIYKKFSKVDDGLDDLDDFDDDDFDDDFSDLDIENRGYTSITPAEEEEPSEKEEPAKEVNTDAE